MNLGQVARLLAGFLLFFSLMLLVPLAVTWADAEYGTSMAFALALLFGVGLAAVLWLCGRGGGKEMYRKEGLVVVGCAWVLAGIVGAVPFLLTQSILDPIDAFFESVSGLTTTGATVLGTANPDIDTLPHSVLLWRSMLQWMGGLGIVLVFIVLLPGMGVTGARLLSSEQVGISDESQRPRMRDQARKLFALYGTLTTLAGLGYWLTGMSGFDALCHAFTTMSTGGFSPHTVSVGGYRNLGNELVAIVFMFLGGCNFLLLLRSIGVLGRQRRVRLLQDSEFRVYLGVTVGVAVVMTLVLWAWGGPVRDDALGFTRDYSELSRCARDAAFQTVSILTSTGYSTANFDHWPRPAVYLLMLCMLVGGCTGSTAGGLKILRVIVCAKLIGYAIRHFIRPRSVEKLRVGGDVVPDRITSAVLALLLLWLASVALGSFVLTLDPRLDMTSAVSTSLSMMGCTGPGISEATALGGGEFALVGDVDVGPYGGYGLLHPLTKLFLAGQMILGRLEILAPLVLITPRFWRK